ncbi:MAG: CheY-like chemotaxis protein [bacterium]|jgi:CheY-like chemotaxis protein
MGKLPLRILVVDDEPSIQDSYLSVLESYKKNPYQQFLNKKFFASEISQNEEVEVEEEENVYQVDYVSQGEQAVQAVIDSKQNNNPYCIIFLDVRMPPGIDGVQTAKKVRQIDDLVEIVIMTAYSDYTFHQIALELGTSQRLLYFQKPFIPNQLRQLTMSLSQRWEVESILNGKKEATTNLFFQDDFCSTLESQDRSVTEKLNLWLQEIQHIDASLKEKADQIY